MKNETITLRTQDAYGYNFAEAVFLMGGVWMKFTVAEKSDWFGADSNKTFQLWGASTMITKEGNGMSGAVRISAETEAVEIISEFGNFRLRRQQDGDALRYGVNNFKGFFVEQI